MSRLKDLRNVVEEKLETMEDAKKRNGAIVHLYGVSLAATMIAKKRGLDPELASMAAMLHDMAAYMSGSYDDHAHRGADLAREILGELSLTNEEETEIICSAIYHHDDKLVVDSPMDEVLKDADVIHHCMNDLSKDVKDKEKERFAALCKEFGMEKKPLVTIEMEDGAKIEIELYPDVAPNTVNNFISLVNKGFYDGLSFHRVIYGFVLQGGDPDGNGTGGPGYSIRGEFTQNGFTNDLKHTDGVISMARAMSPDSAGSQFFIIHKTAPHLDGAYAGFGKVVSGMEHVNAIADKETDYNDMPLEPVVMKKVTVDTFGVTYPEPETLP